MQQVRFAVTGIIGFAKTHITALRKLQAADPRVKLWGIIARDPGEDPEILQELESEGTRIFNDFDAFVRTQAGACDVVTLPTSIPSHAPLSIKAMRAGFHVLTEKPPAATIQDVDAMIRTAEATQRICAVGFQNMYAPSIQNLKRILLSGDLGRIVNVACYAAWPRPDSYYERNPWAGRLAVDGNPVLDGPMNNALAHYLQIMLYLAGDTAHTSADASWVRAELYRGRRGIESDDTGCLRLCTTSGVDVHFNVTHCANETIGPIIELVTERATVRWDRSEVTITERGGRVTSFDNEGAVLHSLMFTDIAESVLEGRAPIAAITAARSFTMAVNGAHESSGSIHPVPDAFVARAATPRGDVAVIKDILDIGTRAFHERQLFSELDVPWAVTTEPVSLTGYSEFRLSV